MIPGLLAQEVAQSLREFIVTGFETETWPFAGEFERLVTTQNDGEAFIKGPYVSVSLPFSKTSDDKGFFPSFKTEHSPFAHQQRSWERLQSSGSPQSTLVATGTGSGKTECFLYPLLDHCLRSKEKGIKAIIIYPMNALAGDQAKRFAEVIHSTPELRGEVTVGLYVGGNSDVTAMSETSVITSRKTLQKNPPDILLTNYKMLDFLLMRPQDQELWHLNSEGMLRYLVVDELHTFDGAQGSDLAMLIRRLKARLKVAKDELICTGTSATLGSGSQMAELADYASKIFDTHFDPKESIIGESRDSHQEFVGKPEFWMLDPEILPSALQPNTHENFDTYLLTLATLFFGKDEFKELTSPESRVALGKHLKQHVLLARLLSDLADTPASVQVLANEIRRQVPPKLSNHVDLVLISFLTLLSHARGSRYPGEPFVTVRLQLWARELRRIVARVGDGSEMNPVNLRFSDDLVKSNTNEPSPDIYVPAVQCTECHTTAWLSCVDEGESNLERDLKKIYSRFFSNHKSIRVYLPLQRKEDPPPVDGFVKHLCSDCGHVQTAGDQCVNCIEGKLVRVFEPILNKVVREGGENKKKSQRLCPVCQSTNSLLLFGSQAASLSAVAVHQMYASHINDDKKLIAFSDSVQDAAHRAGFFAARTWKNNVRMAIAKVVNYHNTETNNPIPLGALFDYLPRFWTEDVANPEQMTLERFFTEFIPPNMQADSAFIAMKKHSLDNTKLAHLHKSINRRLAWEVLSEFGFKSRVGRSLERTGVASLSWQPELIDSASEALVKECLEKFGHKLTEVNAKYMLWGFTLRMKRQGAVFAPSVKAYIENGGDWFYLSRKMNLYMPDYGNYSTLPRFPAEASEKGFDRLLHGKQSTWYSRWLQQFLDDGQLVDKNFLEDFIYLVMKSLVDSGLLIQLETKKSQKKVWALNPDCLEITTDLKALRLERQTFTEAEEKDSAYFGTWYVPAQWQEPLQGMPSLDQTSSKHNPPPIYQIEAAPRESMYRRFYLDGEINRVIGHEHTSLLERNYREDLERRFMAKSKNREPWDENLLSATPTLEMGIDIGDLSSVLLCSVPPSQANYLQRAGRGGRRDGNSFVLTLANGRPHDLYFYADPLKMMAGDVQAPAIFLNAIMVLRRQLFAFCFDQWGVSLSGTQIIPKSMQSPLDAVEKKDLQRFPYTLLEFIDKHRDELWEQFEALLDQEVTEDTRIRLKQYLLATGTPDDELPLRPYVLHHISEVVEQRKQFIKTQKGLESQIKALLKKPKDPARDELEHELNTELEGIKQLKNILNRKDTLNFLTDDGLLPNYAFPEEGTTLRSVIVKRLENPITMEDGKTKRYDSKKFEFSRPAQAALSELAPESVFYANNRKVKIERIEMAEGKNLESWRLCPSCNHSQPITAEAPDEHASCPRCNEPMWANVSQLMPMVKLRQVYANTKEEDAFIGDDSDTREPTFYNKQMLIDFDEEDISLAYEMKTDTRPFGFEFIKRARFKEINFGQQDGSDQTIFVAGAETSRPGFRLCKECGMVQHKQKSAEHMYKCSFRDTDESAGIIDCLYLYRQYDSEAIRVLTPPLSPKNHDTQVQSFVAALQLGLKTRFGGKVDHLNITVSDEPIPGSEIRANYLVIYDTVPGGTGYLHTLLADPENLMDTLRASRQVMTDCDCQNEPEVDGCYNCLYAYKNSYGMERTSRTTALSMLQGILDENVKLEKVTRLGKAGKHTWADSELEKRFPEALMALNQSSLLGGVRIRVAHDIINGRNGFKLEVGDLIYSVEPHVRLGSDDNVAYPCEPDFMITLDRETEDKVQVAVFLDGYAYHKNIVQEDLMKRQGIKLGAGILTWSLTWNDVNQAFAGNEVTIPNALASNTTNAPWKFIHKLAGDRGLTEHQDISKLAPLTMLLKFLSEPDIQRWQDYALLRSLCWLSQKTMQSPEERDLFNKNTESWPSHFVDTFSSKSLVFHTSQITDEDAFSIRTFIAGEMEVVKGFSAEALVLGVVFDPKNPDHKETQSYWQRLLQILNIGQFLPNFFAGTQKGIDDGYFARLEWNKKTAQINDTEWDKIFALADEEFTELLQALASNDIPLPEVGYELANKKGAAIAEAELAWPTLKIALLLDYQLEEGQAGFEAASWKIFGLDDGLEKILSALKGNE